MTSFKDIVEGVIGLHRIPATILFVLASVGLLVAFGPDSMQRMTHARDLPAWVPFTCWVVGIASAVLLVVGLASKVCGFFLHRLALKRRRQRVESRIEEISEEEAQVLREFLCFRRKAVWVPIHEETTAILLRDRVLEHVSGSVEYRDLEPCVLLTIGPEYEGRIKPDHLGVPTNVDDVLVTAWLESNRPPWTSPRFGF